MFEISLLVAVVLALTELTKRMAFVLGKYLPVVSLFLGLAAGLFYVDVPTNARKSAIRHHDRLELIWIV